jgi:hypothetical protein
MPNCQFAKRRALDLFDLGQAPLLFLVRAEVTLPSQHPVVSTEPSLR